MTQELVVLLVLGALPFLLVPFHGIVARLLKLAGIDPGPQMTAIVVALLLNAATAALFTIYAGAVWPAGSAERWYDIGYVVLTANAMWFVYFQVFVNLPLTSLHARLMLEALWNDGPDLQSLEKEYDSEIMLSARINRLRKLRQIAVEDDTIFLDFPCLLWLSYPLFGGGGLSAWRASNCISPLRAAGLRARLTIRLRRTIEAQRRPNQHAAELAPLRRFFLFREDAIYRKRHRVACPVRIDFDEQHREGLHHVHDVLEPDRARAILGLR